jgi:hypothetical protein
MDQINAIIRLGPSTTPPIATAIADRFVENSETFLLGSESLPKTNKSQPPGE